MSKKRILEIIPNEVVDYGENSNVESLIPDVYSHNIFHSSDYMKSSSLSNAVKSNLYLSNKNGRIEFISVDNDAVPPYSTILSEKEFFNIVGVVKRGISKKSGKYQESLYSYYLQAKKEKDIGYISDILNKAVIFRNNLNYIKTLQNKKAFMKEWRKNFGKISPAEHFKNTGSLRMINIIKESI